MSCGMPFMGARYVIDALYVYVVAWFMQHRVVVMDRALMKL